MTNRIAITGASGFIGAELLRVLINDEKELAIVGRIKQRDSTNARQISSIDRDSMKVQLEDFGPDAIIHLATYFRSDHAYVDIEKLVDSNITFGTQLLEVARETGARFLNIGTSWQYYEGSDYAPVSLYAAMKQSLRDIAVFFEGEGLRYSELILFDSYGPRDKRGKLVSQLLEAAIDGREIEMSSGHQLINLTYVDDIVRGIQMAIDDLDIPRLSSLKAPKSLTVRHLVDEVNRVTNNRLQVKWNARPERKREMTTEWKVPAVLPTWKQAVSLPAGLSTCWENLVHEFN